MGLRSRVLTAGSIGCVAAVVAACGSSGGLLSASERATLTGHLDAISSDVQAGDCRKARSQANAFNDAVAALPSSVSSTLVNNLGQGASTVKTLTANCGAGNVSSTTSTQTVTETTSTATVVHTETTAPATTASTASSTAAATTPSVPTQSATTPPTQTTPPAGTGTSTNGGAGLGTQDKAAQ
jgi:hypothetical protein